VTPASAPWRTAMALVVAGFLASWAAAIAHPTGLRLAVVVWLGTTLIAAVVRSPWEARKP
jgi:hypothetical protein